jgi:purine-binding chemotaxis protein CheW
MAKEASLAADATARRFVTFHVGDQRYALPAEQVSEITRLPAIARVPHSPKALMGLANLRGSVLPVASMRQLLGRDEKDSQSGAKAIVLDGAAPIALVVDGVERLIEVEEEDVQTEQAELAALAGERLKGAFLSKDTKAVTKVLDIQALLKAAFAERARSLRQTKRAAPAQTETQVTSPVRQTQRYVTFNISGQEYGLPLDAVREIVPAPQTITAVSSTEPLVLGVSGFRDSILPLLSMRGLLGLPPAEETETQSKVVITAVKGGIVGLVVDSMRAIIAAEEDRVDPMPPLLAARTGGEAKIGAIYRGEGGRRLVSILDLDRLFREDVMERLRSIRAALPSEESRGEDDQKQFLIFRLGDDEYGLPIEAVDEVGRIPDRITRLPKTPKFLEGVVNLRGEVLPVVDQRRRFDLPPLTDQSRRRLIVVRTERHRAGLIVDSVSEVLRIAAETVREPPALTEDMARLVHGVANLEQAGRLIVMLAPDELLTRAERALLDAFEAESKQAGP